MAAEDFDRPVLLASDATLRDAFAMRIMASDWATQGGFVVGVSTTVLRDRARLAYRAADAMLAVREEEHGR